MSRAGRFLNLVAGSQITALLHISLRNGATDFSSCVPPASARTLLALTSLSSGTGADPTE